MHVLSSQIHDLKLRRARTKQKQTALHMLVLSGVIRPGHVELRYTTPVASITAFRTQPTAPKYVQPQPIPVPSWERRITVSMNKTWHCVHSLLSSLVQLVKKPIGLQWSKQLDV